MHGRAEVWNFSSSVHLEEKFHISRQSCIILLHQRLTNKKKSTFQIERDALLFFLGASDVLAAGGLKCR